MPGPWEKYQQAGGEGPWSKYQAAPEPDPDRGPLDKATEAATGVSRGIVGNMLGLTHFLPGDELPFLPESARQARRSARAEVQREADRPDVSNYETGGRIFGGDVLPMALPLGGGRIAAATGAGLTRAVPTLAQLVAFLHSPLETLLGRSVLQQAGILDKVRDVTNIMAPGVGAGLGAIVRGAERAGGAEALRHFGRDNGQDTGTQPTPSSSPVPSAPRPGAAPATPRPSPRPDADTDAPVADRSGRGDRLPLYRAPAD